MGNFDEVIKAAMEEDCQMFRTSRDIFDEVWNRENKFSFRFYFEKYKRPAKVLLPLAVAAFVLVFLFSGSFENHRQFVSDKIKTVFGGNVGEAEPATIKNPTDDTFENNLLISTRFFSVDMEKEISDQTGFRMYLPETVGMFKLGLCTERLYIDGVYKKDIDELKGKCCTALKYEEEFKLLAPYKKTIEVDIPYELKDSNGMLIECMGIFIRKLDDFIPAPAKFEIQKKYIQGFECKYYSEVGLNDLYDYNKMLEGKDHFRIIQWKHKNTAYSMAVVSSFDKAEAFLEEYLKNLK